MIAVKNLSKKFFNIEALKGISFYNSETRDLRIARSEWRGKNHYHQHPQHAHAGNHEYKIDTRKLSAGMYRLHIYTREGAVVKKISVVK